MIIVKQSPTNWSQTRFSKTKRRTLGLRWLTCDICGSKKIEVKTESSDEEWLYNGDPARCLDCCTAGTIETDGDIAWFEVDEEHKNVRIH